MPKQRPTRAKQPTSPETRTDAPTAREALIDEMLQKIRQQLEQDLPTDTATLDQIEQSVAKVGYQINQDLQRRLVEQRNPSDKPPKTQCACGSKARYKGQQTRTIVTVHGSVTYQRACYHCANCQHSFAPTDNDLGVDSGSTTTQVRLWVALLAAQMPFAQAATTLQILTRIWLSTASIERHSVVIGTALRSEQHRQAQQHQSGALPEPVNKPSRLYIGMDGVFVPLREAWKKDKSRGKLTCRFGECKSGVVYEASVDKAGKDCRVRTHAYIATLDKVESFAPLLGTLAHQNGHHRAKEVIVIGDGAAWIWQLAAKQFAGAVQIVDFFHAAEHLGKVTEARFGGESVEGKAWLSSRLEELKTNRLDKVLSALRLWRPSSAVKQQLRESTYAYFANNADRMRYQTFLEKGYHIGSGVVEATCKHVVAQRLDQAGMHWRPDTAEAIVALRAAHLSTTPPDLRPYCRMQN